MVLRRASSLLGILCGAARATLFTPDEYIGRLSRTQARMKEEGMGALFLTLEVHHNYFTGVDTEFWESPTRPYYLLVPAEGKALAFVPTITGVLYEALDHTVGAVHTWSSPQPDDEGVSLMVKFLEKHAKQSGKRLVIGAELGQELHLRMSPNDYSKLWQQIAPFADMIDATMLLHRLRLIKSEPEIAHQRLACHRQAAAMEEIPKKIKAGMTEKEAARMARVELHKAGADRVDYIALSSGQGGYTDIVSAPSNRRLREGDVIFIDTGSVHDNYFCDFNRNWYMGPEGSEIPDELAAVQEKLYQAVEAGIRAAVPGANTADVWHAMDEAMGGAGGNVGRAGHSVGLAITEWPSIMSSAANRNVTLEDGMIFALEPGLGYGNKGQFLVHEENIVVRHGGAELQSIRGPRRMPIIHVRRTPIEV